MLLELFLKCLMTHVVCRYGVTPNNAILAEDKHVPM
jgi:hypothetical protein